MKKEERMNSLKIAVLIPARSGSKSLPHKNIKDYNGHPLLAHSIMLVNKSKYVEMRNCYVSTDSGEYSDIAISYGATVIKRPIELAGDLSTDYDVFEHFLGVIGEGERPDIVIHLRPTYPNRTAKLLDDCIETFIQNFGGYDSLRTIVPTNQLPYKMYHINWENNELEPLYMEYNGIREPYNQCRQVFPQTYIHNGCIDIIKIGTILEKKSMTGDRIYPYVMNENETDDIDTETDFENSKIKMKNIIEN